MPFIAPNEYLMGVQRLMVEIARYAGGRVRLPQHRDGSVWGHAEVAG
ncbi:hypothetical protein Cme02nite_60830 [Catellatospora methionotrophica]|uniref:Uncharacterized protein n=1 Tax=Catellatospora methionotrophica TaxID=121620 RepID=A0A8J3LM09_9ACTN|nr:hypothetical protein Cme02nite_60830 [Catellatospora methionotrophica]